jgi:hypothetical protein
VVFGAVKMENVICILGTHIKSNYLRSVYLLHKKFNKNFSLKFTSKVFNFVLGFLRSGEFFD